MLLDPAQNFAYSQVDTPPSPADSGDTIVLDTGTGSRFPDPASVGEYNIVVKEFRQPAIPTNSEVLRVTAKSGDTLTVDRTQEGSSARTIVAGDEIYMAYTEKLITDLLAAFLVLTPIGSIKMYGGSSAPTGWLICDGSAVSRTTYADLFAIVGTSFGVGDGSTTFNLPDFRGRVAIGLKSTDTDFDTLGETGGAKTVNLQHSHTTDIQHSHGTHDHTVDISHDHGSHNHTQDSHNHGSGSTGGTAISTAEMPSHRHNVYRVAAFAGGGGTGLNDTTSGTQVTAMTLTGSGNSHDHTISATTATNQTTGVSLGSTSKTTSAPTISLGATNKTSDNQLSTTQSIVNPYQIVNFIIKY